MDNTVDTARAYFEGKQIHILPYGHPDFSWTHTRAWHIGRYITMLREAAELLDTVEDFHYFFDCYCTLLEPVLQRHPEIIERMKKHIASGRLAICGTYSNVRPDMVEDEAYIRNIVIGREAFLSVFPNAQIVTNSDATDVAASHSQLPQLLREGGYRYYRFGRPAEIFVYKGMPLDGELVGLDGSKVIFHLSSAAHGFWNRDTVPSLFDEDIDTSIRNLYETEFKDGPQSFTKSVRLKGCGSDDNVPFHFYHPDHPRLPLDEQVKKWRAAGLDLRFSNPDRFFEAWEACPDPVAEVPLPVDICEVSYNVSLGGEKSLIHKRLAGARGIVEAEIFSAIASSLSWQPRKEFTDLWKDNLFVSAHASQWAFTEDYEELTRMANRVIDRALCERTAAYQAIASHIPYDDRHMAVVFNPHDKPVRRAVRLTIPTPDPQKLRLTDGAGRPLVTQPVWPYIFQFMGDMVFEWDFVVMLDLPACGYNTIVAQEGRLDVMATIPWQTPAPPEKLDVAGTAVLENDRLTLRFENGRLRQIVDRRDDTVLTAPTSFNAVRYRRYGEETLGSPVFQIDAVEDVVWTNGERLQNGPALWQICLHGTLGPHTVCQTISLYDGLSEIHFDTVVDLDASEDGILTLSAACEQPDSLYGGIPFGTEPRRVTKEPYSVGGSKTWDDVGGAHRTIEGLFYAKDFVAFRTGEHTLGLCALTGDRYFLYDAENREVGHVANCTSKITPWTWMENIHPTAFQSHGRHRFGHVLLVEPVESPSSVLAEKAQMLRRPVEYVRPLCADDGETLPLTKSFIDIAPENVRLSAYYTQGEQTVLRLYEADGKETLAVVTLPVEFQSVEATDFNGQPKGQTDARLERQRLYVTLKPHQIVTLRLSTEIE